MGTFFTSVHIKQINFFYLHLLTHVFLCYQQIRRSYFFTVVFSLLFNFKEKRIIIIEMNSSCNNSEDDEYLKKKR